jgi:hypothetical protein
MICFIYSSIIDSSSYGPWDAISQFIKIYLERIYNLECIFIHSSHRDYIDSLQTICTCNILCDVESSIKYINLKKALVTRDITIYKELDDKYLVKKYSGSIQYLPTELIKNNTEEVQKFINNVNYPEYKIKKRISQGSNNQYIVGNKELNNLLNNKEIFNYNDHIIQPYINDHKVYSQDFLAVNGKVVSRITKHYHDGIAIYDYYLCKKPIFKKNIYHYYIDKYIDETVKKYNLSGIMQFEFIYCENRKKLYLLEINPRISGVCWYVDDNYNSYYIEKIIIPYLNYFGANLYRKSNHLLDTGSMCIPNILYFIDFRIYFIILFLILILILYIKKKNKLLLKLT